MKLSGNHYLVLNYLGYSWLKQGRNTEQAFGMIVDAYNQAPNDGHISDSLGWAFYQLGMYDQAIAYLEKPPKSNRPMPSSATTSAMPTGSADGKTKPVFNGSTP